MWAREGGGGLMIERQELVETEGGHMGCVGPHINNTLMYLCVKII